MVPGEPHISSPVGWLRFSRISSRRRVRSAARGAHRNTGAAASPRHHPARQVGAGQRGAVLGIATWKVNPVKQGLPRLLPWLDDRRPDVVCLQETKLADAGFDELLGAELDA